MTDPETTRRGAWSATPGATIPVAVAGFLARHVGSQPFVVAVSGGLDSTVLLDAVARCGGNAIVAHVNHGLRGENAARDERFVRRESARHGLPFAAAHLDLDRSGGGLPGRARTARYAALAAIARRRGARWILTAHHADDQVETVFARVVGGAGLDGLGGMRAVAPCPGAPAISLGRPLLDCRVDAIRRHAVDRALVHVHDESNDRLEPQRNRLRHVVLPILREVDPSLEERLLRTAAIARAGSNRVRGIARATLARLILWERPGDIGLDRAAFRDDVDAAVRPWTLREAVRRLSPGRPPMPSRGALESLLAAASGHRTSVDGWRVRRGLYARTDARTLALATRPVPRREALPRPIVLGVGDSVMTADGRMFALDRYAWHDAPTEPFARRDTETLDAATMPTALMLRPVSPSDRIQPLGRRHTVPVLDYLKKRGVPALARRETLVLSAVDDGTHRVAIVWGHTIDHALRVTPRTEHVYRLRETTTR